MPVVARIVKRCDDLTYFDVLEVRLASILREKKASQ